MIWKFVHEQKPRDENRRRHPRHTVTYMRAEIDQTKTRVVNISETGIRITGAPSWMIPGQGVSMRLIFPTELRDVKIPVFGRVLRRNENGMIVVYPPPIDQWSDSLQKLVRAGAVSAY